MRSPNTLLWILLCLLLGPLTAHAQDPLDIRLLQYGTGNVFRPGEITGIEVELTSRLATDASVWVQWDHETTDGDVISYGRQLALSPGQPQSTWLYVPLPPDASLETQGLIRVREFKDGRPERDLGVYQFTPIVASPRLIPRDTGLIGVVGTRTAGLEFYEKSSETVENVSAHSEPTALGMVAVSANLPDSWPGLRPFDTLVWTNAEVELSPAQEAALIEWMERGGHLAIILPQAGNPWSLGAGENGPLGSLMPGSPVINETVPIMSVLRDLTKRSPQIAPAGSMPAYVFRDDDGTFDVAPSLEGWTAAWTLGNVGTVAVQRPVGRGHLSLVGVDLASPSLRAAAVKRGVEDPPTIEHVPEPDVFWNRLLGRRSDTPLSRSMKDLREQERLVRTGPELRIVDDGLIMSETDDIEQVGGGLLTAFFLFIAYWLLAIPVSWAILKSQRRLHLSWFIFFCATVIFSVIAWVIVASSRESAVHARHLTVIDSVHGQDQQRAISWLSLFTPGYTDHELVIEGDGSDLILPWEPSENRLSGFPDPRQTTVDTTGGLNRLVIPSRSTTTPLQIDWRGPIAGTSWGDLLRMDPQRPIHVVRDRDGQATSLRGSIISKLPGLLEDVQIIFVDQQHAMPRSPESIDGEITSWIEPDDSGRMERTGWHWALSDDLPEGGSLMLDSLKLDDTSTLQRSFKAKYSDHRNQIGSISNPMNAGERRRALEALSVYHQLEPPRWIRPAGKTRDVNHAITSRSIGRELDLSSWFSQPVILVTGFLPESQVPLPLRINGEDIEKSEGLAMVRWILPLQDPPGKTGSSAAGR